MLDHGCRAGAGSPVEGIERRSPSPGQPDGTLAGVISSLALDPSGFFEASNNPAEITAIERQLADNRLGQDRLVGRDFVENARLDQRQLGALIVRLQEASSLREVAIKMTKGRD